jgi:signal peptidase II
MSEPQEPSEGAAPADQAAAPPSGEPATPPSTLPESAVPESTVPESTVPASSETASPYKASYVFLLVITLINLAADFFSKAWAKDYFETHRLAGQRRVVVIEDVMNFIFAKNRGGAWGLLQNEQESLRRPFFLIVSVAAIVFIVSLYRKLTPDQRALRWGLPLVLGGALGNLVDRIRYGYVIDFIDVFMEIGGKVKHWPTFNVADIAICVGVGLMAIDMFSPRKTESNAAAAAKVVDLDSGTPTDPGLPDAGVAGAGAAKPAEPPAVATPEASSETDVPQAESGGG